jgi:multidrug efflux pump subunit AcrA (membrane-fusion protein)
MRIDARVWGVVVALTAAGLPLSAAFADPPERRREATDELDRRREQRFQEQLRRAREADRVREADRARRLREAQEREGEVVERKRESHDAARAREERENASLQAAREADRERSARRSRSRRDHTQPAPPAR